MIPSREVPPAVIHLTPSDRPNSRLRQCRLTATGLAAVTKAMGG
jgi:hypothetical protein